MLSWTRREVFVLKDCPAKGAWEAQKAQRDFCECRFLRTLEGTGFAGWSWRRHCASRASGRFANSSRSATCHGRLWNLLESQAGPDFTLGLVGLVHKEWALGIIYPQPLKGNSRSASGFRVPNYKHELFFPVMEENLWAILVLLNGNHVTDDVLTDLSFSLFIQHSPSYLQGSRGIFFSLECYFIF